MSAPELVLCINQSWGCQLNKTYEVIDHWRCTCDSKINGLIEIKGEISAGRRNPKGLMCRVCSQPCPPEVWHFFPEKWFVPITGKPQDEAEDHKEIFGPSPRNPAEEEEIEIFKKRMVEKVIQ